MCSALVSTLAVVVAGSAPVTAQAPGAGALRGGVPSGAASAEVLSLTLDDAVARGLEHNLGLILGQEAVLEAQGARREARADLLPQVRGEAYAHLSDADRAEALDAVREEIGRERRRVSSPHATVETERERRAEAETLREILEAINRQPSLDDTIEEVLKQLARIVAFDSCSLGLLEADGSFRILASRGLQEPASIRGRMFQSPLHETLRHGRSPLALADVTTDERFTREEGAELIRSWAGIPLLVEGEVIGVLCLDRHRVEPFDEEELHRAKAVAFSSAAAIRKAQLLDKVRRYASLMERVANIDEAVRRAHARGARAHHPGGARTGPTPAA
jgi:hypothetical protein